MNEDDFDIEKYQDVWDNETVDTDHHEIDRIIRHHQFRKAAVPCCIVAILLATTIAIMGPKTAEYESAKPIIAQSILPPQPVLPERTAAAESLYDTTSDTAAVLYVREELPISDTATVLSENKELPASDIAPRVICNHDCNQEQLLEYVMTLLAMND